MYISGFSNFNQYKALPSQQSFAQQNSEKTKQKQEEKSIYADKQAREKLEASLSEKELRSLKTEMFFVQSISIASIASIVGLGIYAIVKCKKAQKQIFDDLKNKFLQNLENPDVADIFKDIFQKTEKDGNIIYKLKDGITLDSKNNLNKNGKRINTVQNKAAISMIGGSMAGMFGGCSAIDKIDMRGIDLSRWTSAYGDMTYLNMFINSAQGAANLQYFKLKNQKRRAASEPVEEPVIYLPKDSPSDEFERNVNVTGSGKPTLLLQLDAIFRGIRPNTHIYIANHEGYNILGRAAYDASADLQYYSCYDCPRLHADIYNKNTFKFRVQNSSGDYYTTVYYDLLLNNDIINNNFVSFKNNDCSIGRYTLTTSALDSYIFYAPWDWDNLSQIPMMESFYPKKPFFGIWVDDNPAVTGTYRPGARNTVDFVAKTLNMANAVRENQPCMLQPNDHPYPSVDHKDVVTFLW